MSDFFWNFLLAFVPIFVAVDAPAILPMYLGLTDGLEPRARRSVLQQAFVTALAVAVGFVFLGKAVFQLLGITVGDFMVAGGVILFAISLLDLTSGIKFARRVDVVGAVPLGTPLMVGPAVLTASLILVDLYGVGPTLLSIFVNLTMAWALLRGAEHITRTLGPAGSGAISKVSSLILAAFAVMMVRRGIEGIIAGTLR